ncbi:simple sugar transport system substrate-binding protein, partial [Lactonifactor longoviformis DSM 17459]
MKRKVLSALLCATMMAGMLAGCGNDSSESSSADTETKTESTDTAEAGDEADAADTKGDDDLIVVGYAQVGAESDWRTANTESFKSTFTEE